ncbi:MAG: hypothetical protein LBE59_08870 [Nevskiaceae bacterium]|jgi:nucleoid-associated protein YejK|nr:hypothetical protein [Nevskiaceae bacterium]
MPKLYNHQTGALLGQITDDDVRSLVDQLEEEDSRDVDYFVDANTIDLLEQAGASATLLALLRKAVGNSEGLEVRYEA